MDGLSVQGVYFADNSYKNYPKSRAVQLYGQFGYQSDWYSKRNLNDIVNLEEMFANVVKQQGIVGKSWDFIKNTFKLKNGSNDVSAKLKLYKDGLISQEEAQNSVKSYIKGHKKVLDFLADWGSTAVGAGAFLLASSFLPTTLGVCIGISALSGGLFKVGAKALDAKTGGRKYNTGNYDFITGAINGMISPIVNSIGNFAVKTTANSLGIKSMPKKTHFKPIATADSRFLKFITMFPKQVLEGSFVKKSVAYLSGKAFRFITKFGTALAMREIAFNMFSKDSIYSGNKLLSKLSMYSMFEQDLLNGKIESSQIDLSNDVYNTGEKEE